MARGMLRRVYPMCVIKSKGCTRAADAEAKKVFLGALIICRGLGVGVCFRLCTVVDGMN